MIMSDRHLFCAHMSCIRVLSHVPFFLFLSHVTDNILAYKCTVCATIYLSNSCLPIPACLSHPFRRPLLPAQPRRVLLLKSRGAFPRLFLSRCATAAPKLVTLRVCPHNPQLALTGLTGSDKVFTILRMAQR